MFKIRKCLFKQENWCHHKVNTLMMLTNECGKLVFGCQLFPRLGNSSLTFIPNSTCLDLMLNEA